MERHPAFPGEEEAYDRVGIPKGPITERRVMDILRQNFCHDIKPCLFDGWGEGYTWTPSTQARISRLFAKLVGEHQFSKFGYASSQADRGWVVSWAKSRKSEFKCATLEEIQNCWVALMRAHATEIMRGQK